MRTRLGLGVCTVTVTIKVFFPPRCPVSVRNIHSAVSCAVQDPLDRASSSSLYFCLDIIEIESEHHHLRTTLTHHNTKSHRGAHVDVVHIILISEMVIVLLFSIPRAVGVFVHSVGFPHQFRFRGVRPLLCSSIIFVSLFPAQ